MLSACEQCFFLNLRYCLWYSHSGSLTGLPVGLFWQHTTRIVYIMAFRIYFFVNIRFGLIPLCRADDCMKYEAVLSADLVIPYHHSSVRVVLCFGSFIHPSCNLKWFITWHMTVVMQLANPQHLRPVHISRYCPLSRSKITRYEPDFEPEYVLQKMEKVLVPQPCV